MHHKFLDVLGIKDLNSGVCFGEWIRNPSGGVQTSVNPATGEEIAKVLKADPEDYEKVVTEAEEAFRAWRMMPAPKRGEIVRELGDALRLYKNELGALVTLETGKILEEGKGEVQEMIDLSDFAVGLSRRLYGRTLHSERPGHRIFEQWHPLGLVGVITAFNFPVAVKWWNSGIAAVCGDTMLWKPSPVTPLCAIAVQNICNKVLGKYNLRGIFNLVIGDDDVVGKRMVNDRRLPLISATGSCNMGRQVAEAVGRRLGRHLLELGGNNAVVVMNDADLNLVLRSTLFGAVGTAGQRCTTTRRLIMQRGIAKKLTEKLVKAYSAVRIGDPFDPRTIMGPLINRRAVENMMTALKVIIQQGGKIIYGGRRLNLPGGLFVEPTIVQAHKDMPILLEEIFAPLLSLVEFDTLEEAIEINNSVPQGLASSIFTDSLRVAELFYSHAGSDCGQANVNVGTSGAEVGVDFGGPKDTGGGLEAGGYSWPSYMRLQTSTVNWSGKLPLAQGIEFGEN